MPTKNDILDYLMAEFTYLHHPTKKWITIYNVMPGGRVQYHLGEGLVERRNTLLAKDFHPITVKDLPSRFCNCGEVLYEGSLGFSIGQCGECFLGN